jgi:type VI secretion system ImpA family protein
MIDLESLLQPLAPERPAGEELRSAEGQTSLSRAQELRRRDDPSLVPAGVEPRRADWRGVIQACQDGLSRESKDLELAAYLTEALTATHGFAGLAAGLGAFDGLLARFWPNLHPGAEPDGTVDTAFRARWLNWLNHHQPLGEFVTYGDFLGTVRRIPLTSRDGDDSLTLADYEEAMQLERMARMNTAKHEEMVQSGATTRAQWDAAFGAAPPDLREQNREQIALCLERVGQLASRCAELFGDDVPSFAKLRDVLEGAQRLHAGGDGGGPAAAGDGDVPAAAAGGGARGGGPIQSRADALQRLREVSAYLHAAEPHSPVPFLIDRSIAWLQMSFEELILDLLKAHEPINEMRATLGLPPLTD